MKKIFFLLIIFLAACGEIEIYEPLDFYEPCVETDELEIEIQPQTRTIPDDGVLRLHMRPPTTFNPLLNEDATVARILRLIFEPLAVLDESFRVTGFLAELEFASDYGSVIATIRDGAIWSDGKPVTADDIIFTIELLRGAGKEGNIASAARVDARTVRITFDRASVMAGYSLNFPILPRHFDEKNPVGSGAFMLSSHAPTRSMTLARNPYFRDATQIEEVEIIFLPDFATDFAAFERGRIDALHLPLTDWTRHGGVRSPVYEVFPAMYFEFIGFNYRKNIFRDIHTRRGIAHAFNACDAVSGLYLSHAARSVTPVHPYNWAADDNIPPPLYDPSRAAALLGTIRLDQPLTIIANAENPQRVSIAMRLAGSLTSAGLPAHAEILPSEEYFSRIATHDFDLFIGGMELPFAPDVQVFFNGGLSPHDPALEAAYTNLALASTEAAFAQAMSRLQHVFVEQLPVIGLAFKHSAVLANPRIITPLNPMPDHAFANINGWEIK
jgi:peptide/nickel transport system substrate-binding protein